jgi:hypothetical protein
LLAWSAQGVVDGNHTPGCIAGSGIVLQPDQAYLFEGPRGSTPTR